MSFRYLLILVYFGIIPLLLGNLIVAFNKKEKWKSIGWQYIIGWVSELAIFHILCMVAYRAGASIATLGICFNVTMVGLLVADIIIFLKQYHNKNRNNFIDKKINIQQPLVLFVTLLFIGAQLYLAMEYMPAVYSDDITYITIVNDMAEKNVFYGFRLWDGYETGSINIKQVLTSYYAYCAVLAQNSSIHPLVLCKTILPVIYILIYYLIWNLFATIIFESNGEKRSYFMMFMSAITMFAEFSQYTLSKRIMLYSWNGKTVLFALILPVVVLCCLTMFEFDRVNRFQLILITVLSFSGIATSLSSLFFMPIIICIFSFITLIKTKKIRCLFNGIVLCIPNIIYAGYVLIYIKGAF